MGRKKFGLALGGGVMRGMAHIGALEILQENNLLPDILTGCSSGALVAAAYACGKIDDLKEISLSANRKSRRQMLDFCLTGEGLIKGEKMRDFFDYITDGKNFEDIGGMKLAFVGTDALTGNAVVVDEGSIAEALEITTALPGIAPMKRHKGRLVFDGGTAMMVPARIAYDLGAEKVVAIDVSAKRSLVTRLVGDIRTLMRKTGLGKITRPLVDAQEAIRNAEEKYFLGQVRELMKKINLLDDHINHKFSFLETYLIGLRVISFDYEKGMFHEEEADLAIRPDVFHIRRSDVTRMKELIAEGRKATKNKLDDIRRMII
jgi:predicted acylesterase/phospholipase RssA